MLVVFLFVNFILFVLMMMMKLLVFKWGVKVGLFLLCSIDVIIVERCFNGILVVFIIYYLCFILFGLVIYVVCMLFFFNLSFDVWYIFWVFGVFCGVNNII